MFGWKFGTDPGWGDSNDFWLENMIVRRPGGADGGAVRRSERGCHSIKRAGLGLANVWIGCWVGSVDVRMLGVAKTKVVRSYAPRGPC